MGLRLSEVLNRSSTSSRSLAPGRGFQRRRSGRRLHPSGRKSIDGIGDAFLTCRKKRCGYLSKGLSHESCAYAEHLGLGRMSAFGRRRPYRALRQEGLGQALRGPRLAGAHGVVDTTRKTIAAAKAYTVKPPLIRVRAIKTLFIATGSLFARIW